MIEAFTSPGRFWRGNLHCHSTRSDGDLAPDRVCHFYASSGYDFICLTDHFLEKYGYPITDTTAFRQNGFTTLPGAELHVPDTALGEMWHILAVGLPAGFAQPHAGETGPELAARAAAAGAFVAIPHPEWYTLTADDALALDAAHAIEVYNAICAYESGRGGGESHLDALLVAGRRLGAIAVDDAHRYRADALKGWVMVKAPENEPDALLAALRAGAFYASQGPAFEHVSLDETGLALETSAVDKAYLVGPGSRYASVHDAGVTRMRFALDRYRGAWCRAVIVDAEGRKAWTNPLWLDGS